LNVLELIASTLVRNDADYQSWADLEELPEEVPKVIQMEILLII